MEDQEKQITTTVSVRMDVIDLATLAYVYDQLKVEYTSRSNLLGIALHQYIKLLNDVFSEPSGEKVEFESPQQAVDYLYLNKRLKIRNVKVGESSFQDSLKRQVKISVSELDPSIRAKELMEEVDESVDEKGIPEHLQKK